MLFSAPHAHRDSSVGQSRAVRQSHVKLSRRFRLCSESVPVEVGLETSAKGGDLCVGYLQRLPGLRWLRRFR